MDCKPKLIDVKVTREDWFALANSGVIARIAGPTTEELQAIASDLSRHSLAVSRLDADGTRTRIDPADFYLPPEEPA